MKQVIVTSAIKLTSDELNLIKQNLHLAPTDTISTEVNPSLIAGIKIVVDGKALDLTVKRQLADIVGTN